jgi:hypothetical protein
MARPRSGSEKRPRRQQPPRSRRPRVAAGHAPNQTTKSSASFVRAPAGGTPSRLAASLDNDGLALPLSLFLPHPKSARISRAGPDGASKQGARKVGNGTICARDAEPSAPRRALPLRPSPSRARHRCCHATRPPPRRVARRGLPACLSL